MTVRFQADADLNVEIVTGVLRREPSLDFQTAEAAQTRRLPDQTFWRSQHKKIVS